MPQNETTTIQRIDLKETAIIFGLMVNILATVGAYVDLRVNLEHRLTKAETEISNLERDCIKKANR